MVYQWRATLGRGVQSQLKVLATVLLLGGCDTDACDLPSTQ